jgi:peptide/nickel transport system substrate-binding protein
MPSIPTAAALTRRQVFVGGGAVAASVALASLANPARADAPLRVATSLTDIPRLSGSPEGGFEGLRFAGYPIYDPLINWDLTASDKPSSLVPALAESWQIDPQDKKRWILKLRQDVSFHDGSRFDADAALWNFAAIFDAKAPHYDGARAATTRSRMPSIVGAEKIDDHSIAVITESVDAMTPYQLTFLLHVSPAQYTKLGNDWSKFAAEPSGTGPFRVAKLAPHIRLDLARNDAYWDKQRMAKSPLLAIIPIPDPNSRVAALRSGEVDFIESVPPDTIASLKGAGFKVLANIYPHIWGWRLNTLPDSPFADLRVRRAANLGIDRTAIVNLLDGTAVAAKGLVAPSSPWFGKPSFDLRYDLVEAKRLMAEAGYGPSKHAKARILISANGGGQMQPLPMNEFIQSNLAQIWLDVEFQVSDFAALFTAYRNGAKAPQSAGIHGINLASPTQEPASAFLRGFLTDYAPPRGSNWSYYSNPEVDQHLREAQQALEPEDFNHAMARAHELLVEDAVSLIVVHDTNPRALSERVRGFVQPQNWFADFTSVTVA